MTSLEMFPIVVISFRASFILGHRDMGGGAANWTNEKKTLHCVFTQTDKTVSQSLLPAKLSSYSSSVIPTAGPEHLQHRGRMKRTRDLIIPDSLLALLQLIIIQRGHFGQN